MYLKDGEWPVNYESVILFFLFFFLKFEHLEEQNKIFYMSGNGLNL